MSENKQKLQADKFRETARELKADESPDAFEQKLKKIIGTGKPAPKPAQKDD